MKHLVVTFGRLLVILNSIEFFRFLGNFCRKFKIYSHRSEKLPTRYLRQLTRKTKTKNLNTIDSSLSTDL